MTELRKDLLTDNWVIIAEDRNDRPHDFTRQHGWEESASQCPFEPGHEEMTPPEIDRISANGQSDTDWLARAIPNKYNALSPDEKLQQSGNGIFRKMTASGGHEVIVESPEHHLELCDFEPEQYRRVFELFTRRLTEYRDDDRIQFVQIFRNEGREAGASLVHPHSQILAFPFIPQWIENRLRSSSQYYRNNGRCIFCDLVDAELDRSERIIEENENFISLAPYSSRFPYETWIIPRRHVSDMIHSSVTEMDDFSRLLPRTLGRLHGLLEDPPFNLIFQNTPYPFEKDSTPRYLDTLDDHHHWHIEIIPRLKQTAGLELSTDTHINTVFPETAAQELKSVEMN